MANSWDPATDAIGVAANNKPYDGTTTATINLYDTLINTCLLYTSPFNGIDLSLLRSRVNTNGIGTYESSIMQMAQARGAKVWSTPWSPPPQFKSNGNINGGNYLGSGANATNLAYASLLAQYVVNMKNLSLIHI